MSKAKFIATLFAFSIIVRASDENPDMEFLEWLGQVTEVEELGVDIENLMDSRSEDSDESEQEQSQ